MNAKRIISYLLPLVLGLGLLRWVFKEIDLRQTLSDFQSANYLLVVAAGLLALLSHILRAARWVLMLKPMGYKPSVYQASLAVLVGYLTNLLFPRAGEVARAVSLQKSEGVPFDKSFGAVLAERLTDVVVLLVLMLVNLALEYDRILTLFQEILPEQRVGWIVSLLGIFVVLVLFALFKFRHKLYEVRGFARFRTIFKGIKEGFVSVLNLENPGRFVLQSLSIWILYYLSSLLLCYSLDIGSGLSPLAILTLLVMGTIGMALPTVGGIGSYHLLVGKIVILYGLSNQDGVSLATFLHTMNGILFVVLFGVVALALHTFSASRKPAQSYRS